MFHFIESLEPRRLLSSSSTGTSPIDPTFGDQGYFIDKLPTGVERMALAADGKIVLAAQTTSGIQMERYTADGHPDANFGSNGHQFIPLTFNLPYAQLGLHDLRVLFDGRIEFTVEDAVGRLLTNGALDPSLNSHGTTPGIETLPIPANSDANWAAAAPTPDGGFVFMVTGSPPADNAPLYLGRLTPDGSLDPSFGTGGVLVTKSHLWDRIFAMTVTDDGTIFAAGGTKNYYETFNSPLVLRFDAHGNALSVSGTPPPDYGISWLRRAPIGGGAIVAGSRSPEITYSTISAAGVISTPFELTVRGQTAPFQALALDAAGDIYAGGTLHRNGGGSDFAIARFLPSGDLDTTYGIARIPPPDGSAGPVGIVSAALDSQNRLVVAGGTSGGETFLARVLPTPFIGPAPDVAAPSAVLASALATVRATGPSIVFQVTYSDDLSIDRATIGDLTITGPGGGRHHARLASLYHLSDLLAPDADTPITATYLVTGKGGGPWSHADNGTYTIRLPVGRVADTSGHFNAETIVGRFKVSIPNVPRAAGHGHAH